METNYNTVHSCLQAQASTSCRRHHPPQGEDEGSTPCEVNWAEAVNAKDTANIEKAQQKLEEYDAKHLSLHVLQSWGLGVFPEGNTPRKQVGLELEWAVPNCGAKCQRHVSPKEHTYLGGMQDT